MGESVAAPPAADEDVAARDDVLARWVDPSLRATIEERFWAPIERMTSLEAMVADPAFVADPGRHVGLYSDHGPNHARDVAARAATIADWAIGTLVADRDPGRAAFVTGTAVMISLLHDVGMCADPPVGRRLHAQYATQLVFAPAFAGVMSDVLATDAGRIRSALERVGLDATEIGRAAREVLACAVAHSKSTVPTPLLDDRAGFRSLLQFVERTELARQPDATDRTVPDDGSYAWLVDPALADVATDVVDAIRIVRAADALRQRGTTLRTSSGFEVVVDARTGDAVAVLRSASGRSAFLLDVDTPLVVGEADIRGAELGPDAVRFQFHRGSFADDTMAESVARAVAGVVDDIQLDILPSFPGRRLDLELATPHDDPTFAERVRRAFAARRPELDDLVRVVDAPPTPGSPPGFDWRTRGRALDPARMPQLAAELDAHGLRISGDHHGLFDDVVVVDVEAGETVIAPGEEASFVVVPLGDGLDILPLGGYRAVATPPYVPVGTIGVLRGHDRNSAVVASRAVEVLVVPDHAYLDRWAGCYDAAALVARVQEGPLP